MNSVHHSDMLLCYASHTQRLDMVHIQQMALKHGTSASGAGDPALPSLTQPLMYNNARIHCSQQIHCTQLGCIALMYNNARIHCSLLTCCFAVQQMHNEAAQQDMVRIQQMALERGTSSSGEGGPALPSLTQPLMQQKKS